MKQEILDRLLKLASEYNKRAKLAFKLDEIKNANEYADKSNAIFEAMEIVRGIKENK